LKARNYTFLAMMEELNVFMKQLACVRVCASNSKVRKEDVITQENVEDNMGMGRFFIDLWNLRSFLVILMICKVSG
jgi:hypothetical protein